MAPIRAQAFVQRGDKHVQDSVLVPEPGERELLVRVLYTAQNPVDGKVGGASSMGLSLTMQCSSFYVHRK